MPDLCLGSVSRVEPHEAVVVHVDAPRAEGEKRTVLVTRVRLLGQVVTQATRDCGDDGTRNAGRAEMLAIPRER